MSPTPCDRSISPSRRPAATPPATPTDLSTIEKLQARVWLMEEELNFSTKMQTRSEVEAREWNNKLLAMRHALQDAKDEYDRLSAARLPPGPVPLSAEEQQQQLILERLKQKIAEIGEKRQEYVEEIEQVRDHINRSQSKHEAEHGSRHELMEELAILKEKFQDVNRNRELQENAFNTYEASREDKIAEEVTRIEKHVMSKLDAMKGRSDQARNSIESTKGNLEQLKLEHALKTKQEEKAKAKHTKLEGQLKEKAAKTEGEDSRVQTMLAEMEDSRVKQDEERVKLESTKAQQPEAEAEMQLQVKTQRKENIRLLTQKALLLDALGDGGQASKVREEAERLNLTMTTQKVRPFIVLTD